MTDNRPPNTTVGGNPFDDKTIRAVWEKATALPGFKHIRHDACGAPIQESRFGYEESRGWEIDHIKPVSAGGTDALDNLQPLQWQNNRQKGDQWPEWTCKVISG